MYGNGQAAFNCLVEILKQLFKRLALSGATGYGRDFSPKAAFFRFMKVLLQTCENGGARDR